MSKAIEDYGLDYAQLHGAEGLDFCWEVKSLGVGIIKAISVKDDLPIDQMTEYEKVVDCFLFDTSGARHGGNGVKFDWNILKKYTLSIPFFLSGGISPGDESILKALDMEQLIGYDINSRFESSPGVKKPNAVKEFIDSIMIQTSNREQTQKRFEIWKEALRNIVGYMGHREPNIKKNKLICSKVTVFFSKLHWITCIF